MPDSPAHRMLSRAQRGRDPLAEYRAVVQGEDKGMGRVAVDPSLGSSDRYDPNATPAAEFERYMAGVEEQHVTRPQHRPPSRWSQAGAIVAAIVAVGVIAAVVLRGMGLL